MWPIFKPLFLRNCTRMSLFRTCIIVLLLSLPLAAHGQSRVRPADYGLALTIDSATASRAALRLTDSLLRAQPQLKASTPIQYAIQRPRLRQDQTVDFYLLLALVLLLGFIRLLDPRYFGNLWRVFRNPSLTGRQYKEQLGGASIPNLLMNLFFAASAGAYMFYLARVFTPHRTGAIPPSLLVTLLIAGMMLLYAGKYAVVRFSGWAFRIEEVTEQYLFNVFLVNKILAVALLPFIVLLAFTGGAWSEPAIILSLVLIVLLFISRYARSWQVFGSFFQYSKFHFITYLCASEILPLAILMKLIMRGLLY